MRRVEWLLVAAGAVALGLGYAGTARAAGERDTLEAQIQALPVWQLRACLKQPVEQGCYEIGRDRWTDLATCRGEVLALADRMPGARLQCAVDRKMVNKFRAAGVLP